MSGPAVELKSDSSAGTSRSGSEDWESVTLKHVHTTEFDDSNTVKQDVVSMGCVPGRTPGISLDAGEGWEGRNRKRTSE